MLSISAMVKRALLKAVLPVVIWQAITLMMANAAPTFPKYVLLISFAT